jgi:lipoate-protein ligase B
MSTARPRRSHSSEMWVCHLGTVPYPRALATQERVRAQRLAGELPDTLLLLQHPPVYTRGRRSGAEDLPFAEDFYRAKGIEVHTTDRGGRLTYHGPGQLVGYPIMAIEDIGSHLRTMEGALIAALAEDGVEGRSRHQEGIDFTGVWVEDRKIASIGVHVSRAISTHGFALNVENDLEPFSWVIACGLPDVAMTSLRRELEPAPAPGLACVRKRVGFHFARAHGRRQRLVSPHRLGIDTANTSGLATGRAPLEIASPPRERVPAYPMAGHR